MGCKVLKHPLYSKNLMSNNICLFGQLRKSRGTKGFKSLHTQQLFPVEILRLLRGGQIDAACKTKEM
jgi:hypothetical protein